MKALAFLLGMLCSAVVLAEDIPKDGLKAAEKVFELRARLNHAKRPDGGEEGG